jgi:maltose O-acetyltransferase
MSPLLKSRLRDVLTRLRGEHPLSWYLKEGLVVGERVNLLAGFRFDPGQSWLIELGDDVTFAPDVHVIAHDASTYIGLGYARIARVRIGNRVFIGARSTILPGARIGDDCVIGAGSVVTGEIPSGSVAAGNPARVVGTTEDYLARQRSTAEARGIYDRAWSVEGGITDGQKKQMRADLEDGPGFIP